MIIINRNNYLSNKVDYILILIYTIISIIYCFYILFDKYESIFLTIITFITIGIFIIDIYQKKKSFYNRYLQKTKFIL